MKLRCQLEDFVVDEQIERLPKSGSFGLYQLHKTDIGTLEALYHVRRVWNLSASQVSHAGLKDRHAQTSQWITIRNGPPAGLQSDRLKLVYRGRTSRPLDAGAIRSNHFEIVLRQLTSIAAKTICERAGQHDGLTVPNFFDQQRFGSLGYSSEFAAAAWCRRNYEQAVWLLLADPNSHDRSEEKQQKQILRDNWGSWSDCRQLLNRSHRRSIVTYLDDHPTRFRKALALIRPELRGLCLAAFQSAVWNRMLVHCLGLLSPDSTPERVGDMTIPVGLLNPELLSRLPESLPLPSARCRNLTPVLKALANESLAPYELTLEKMKVVFPRDRFFARGQRSCWIRPGNMCATPQTDERYAGFTAVRLAFELPPGCYATMLVKALTSDIQMASAREPCSEPVNGSDTS